LTDADLIRFFRSRLAHLRPSVIRYVPAKIDPNRESYFEEVLEPAPIVSQEDIITSLMENWRRLGLQGLVELEPDIRRMAKELRAPDTEDQKISDFIYAMY